MPRSPEQYAVYNSRRKCFFPVFVSSVFVIALLLLSLKKTPPWHIWLCGSFFGLCMIVGLYTLLDRRPKLILDRRGIHDRRARGQYFPWEAIREVYLVNLASQRFLSLKLDESHPDVRSPSARAIRLNGFFGMEPFNISIGELRVDPNKLCTAALIMSRIPPDERETLLMTLVDTDGLLPGERPDPHRD